MKRKIDLVEEEHESEHEERKFCWWKGRMEKQESGIRNPESGIRNPEPEPETETETETETEPEPEPEPKK